MSVTNYDHASDAIFRAAQERRSSIVSCHAVHALVTFSGDKDLCEMANTFEMITPDGQPVRWAMNWLHRTRLQDRVYGPELMERVCQRSADEKMPIYLYGGTPESLKTLQSELEKKHPGISIVGAFSPPFRDLSEQERADVIQDINQSGAGIVFIGLGCPKQDIFAHSIREHLSAVQICVGAAFDFHAGVKPMAPKWMQRFGMEWIFRLSQEPGRLWRRYLVTNSQYLWRLLKATFSRRK